ncbi:MAG: hypothetical protein ABIF77_17590 [bacterium]
MLPRIASVWSICLFCITLLGSPASGQIIYVEDFEDGVADGFDFVSGDWSVTPEGTLLGQVYGVAEFGLSRVGDEEWSVYFFSGDIKVDGSLNHVINFRIASPDDYYQLNVRADPFNDAYLYRFNDGVRTELHYTLFLPTQVNEWHHFFIDVANKRIMILWDNMKVCEIIDDDEDAIINGRVGPCCFGGGNIPWQHAEYDNLKAEIFVVETDHSTWGEIKHMYR